MTVLFYRSACRFNNRTKLWKAFENAVKVAQYIKARSGVYWVIPMRTNRDLVLDFFYPTVYIALNSFCFKLVLFIFYS